MAEWEKINRLLDLSAVKRLACELIDLLRARFLENKKKRLVNALIKDVKAKLRIRSSAVQIKDVDLYETSLDAKRVTRFNEIVKHLRNGKVVYEEFVQGFRVIARKGPFKSAGELKTASGEKTAFKEAFNAYSNPYDYLRKLLENDSLRQSDLYRLFSKITYQILNRDGIPVSGGERSEFRLLEEIKDAQKFDMLLIDEPESSFDNLFLKSDVNAILADISRTMPVIVVTHNSTVGASIGADYLLYAQKDNVDGDLVFRIYSGYPSDRQLRSPDGQAIENHKVTINSLEAGQSAYDQRRSSYEAIENRE